MMELTTDQMCILLAVNAVIMAVMIILMALYLKEGEE
jgi:hypothetical protein